MARYLLVGLGGFLGAVTRYWLGTYIGERMGSRFPYGTFLINITGCFLIGMIITVLDERTHLSAGWRYFVPIGFIGAYTTFSTFELETLRNVQEGALATAALNVVLSVVLGFAAVWLGMTTANAVLNLNGTPTTVQVLSDEDGVLAGEVSSQQQVLMEPES